jgi:hypothetical protein
MSFSYSMDVVVLHEGCRAPACSRGAPSINEFTLGPRR